MIHHLKHISVFLFASLLFLSCEDYLDKSPDKDSLTDVEIFSRYEFLRRFMDQTYLKLYTPFSGMYSPGEGANHLVSSSLCDETFPSMLNGVGFTSYLSGDYQAIMELNGAPVYAAGNWAANGDFLLKWPLAWQGIAICNDVINNIDMLSDASTEQTHEILGQAYFLRAYFHFEIMIRWGGFEYSTQNMRLSEISPLKRTTFTEMMAGIIQDCQVATGYLPHKWRDADQGRPPKAAPMALKSRALLYYASPLFNPGNDVERWKKAADASWELINYAETTGHFGLIDAAQANSIDVGYDQHTNQFGSDLYVFEPEKLRPYRSIHLYNPINKEVIFNQHRDNNVRWVDGTRQISHHISYLLGRAMDWYGWPNTSKGNGATLNIVNMFETSDGYRIDDPESGYNLQNPHINRDPRFYANILFDSVPTRGRARTVFRSANTMSYTAGVTQYARNPTSRIEQPSPVQTTDIMNVTGYVVRKYWPLGWYNTQPDEFIQNVIFRLAEIYLNYAEAAFEGYGGASGASPGATYTALQAVNKIRNRVGMPDVLPKYTSDAMQLRERIHNERAIELCFENQRYWDLRRWRQSHLNENRQIKVMNINFVGGKTEEYPTGYRFEEDYLRISDVKHELVFEERHYWWPLRRSEVELFEEFGQTPGW